MCLGVFLSILCLQFLRIPIPIHNYLPLIGSNNFYDECAVGHNIIWDWVQYKKCKESKVGDSLCVNSFPAWFKFRASDSLDFSLLLRDTFILSISLIGGEIEKLGIEVVPSGQLATKWRIWKLLNFIILIVINQLQFPLFDRCPI